MTIELNDIIYVNDDLFDPGFESPFPKGFSTGGNGYSVQLDSQVFHSGHQSLRMTKVPSMDNPNAVDPLTASSIWKEVVSHMEAAREAYQKKGIALSEIEWAIQNARVVWQCMQMRAGRVSRDDSMAENIKWILDQNPGAKIVLWAHNGHVSTASSAPVRPMGASLRSMYGKQMVVFGFSFNQGSFQAVEQDKGLRDFTVLPAPDDSFDAALASTGIPIFALDLRAVPRNGPVADWFGQSRRSRSIGALFSNSMAAQYLMNMNAAENFDAILFVEKTASARKNPPLSVVSCQDMTNSHPQRLPGSAVTRSIKCASHCLQVGESPEASVSATRRLP